MKILLVLLVVFGLPTAVSAKVRAHRFASCPCSRIRVTADYGKAQVTPAEPEPDLAPAEPTLDLPLRYQVFRDARGEWRWHIKAANNRIIGDSAEGYKNKSDCMHGIDIILAGCKTAVVSEVPLTR